jgi:integrase
MPKRLTPRHLVKKGSKFYWQPSASLRRLGLKPERLPDDPLVARQRAEALNAKADAIRLAARRVARANRGQAAAVVSRAVNPHPQGTVSWLIHRWAGDVSDWATPGACPEFRRLAPSSRREYVRHLRALREVFGQRRITSMTPRVIHTYRDALSDEDGLLSRSNRFQLQVLQSLLAFAVNIGELPSNPATKLRLTSNPPRRTYWTDADVERFLAANPPPSIRLALMLALWTAQRQADVLNMRWSDISGPDAEGRLWITIEQRKSRRVGRAAKRVAIPISRELAAQLDKTERTGVNIVVCENTRRPYIANSFRYAWRAATKRAGMDGYQFLDLRRSAVVRLATVGCGVGQIASFTGHSIARTQAIIDTYFVSTKDAAAEALAKLERSRAGGDRA